MRECASASTDALAHSCEGMAAMNFGLREKISFCQAGGRHFFLDRARNRYFALPDKDDRIFREILARNFHGSADLSSALSALLTASGDRPPVPFRLQKSPRQGLPAAGTEGFPRFLPMAVASYCVTKFQLSRKSFDQLLGELASQKARLATSPLDEQPLLALGASFEVLRAFVGQDQCLPLSLACARSAYSLGYPVELVFGVTPRPFGAHCWIQLDTSVINDTLGRVEYFTPIYSQ